LLTPLLFFSHPFMSHTIPNPPTLGDSAVNTPYVAGIAFSAALRATCLVLTLEAATNTLSRLDLLHVANHYVSASKKQWT
jgi:hypothetical protein